MYKPPENCNRVKSIKSKFENIENRNDKPLIIRKNGVRSDLKKTNELALDLSKQNLSRQLSDPAKRNIKRSPAFRVDNKNTDKNGPPFQRGTPYNKSYYLERLEQFNSALKNNCDNNRNIIDRTDNNYKDKSSTSDIKRELNKPPLIKSKSSHDFAYIRSKFDRKIQEEVQNNENQRRNNDLTSTKKLPLYTEPVPKSQRLKPAEDDVHSANTLKLCDNLDQSGLTDTLKAALNRPLPTGPAPTKPPRTFEHKQTTIKNTSFLHNRVTGGEEEGKSRESKKHDPRYMLSKLESALRNNRIGRQVVKHETSTTSGEDSDDSLLFKSKRELPSLPDEPANSFNLNCLNGLALCKTTSYETIKEPNSAFFVSCKEEPVYAEPFSGSGGGKGEVGRAGTSLYYMSTPLLGDEGRIVMNENSLPVRSSDDVADTNRRDVKQKQISAENSSLSSCTSDLESAASTPLEEQNSLDNSLKIKQLINSFESKQQSDNMTKKEPIQTVVVDASHRVEDLKMTLQRTLERCFDHDDNEEEKERKVSVESIINKFQTYVKTMPKYQKPKVNKDDRLFYCCLIVGWDTKTPQIKFKFPSHVKIPERIEDLCYPEAASGPLDISDNAQCYSLVITNDRGERTFGYCRRVIPEGSRKCIPLAYCILSKHRAPRFYKKILMELESRHGIPDKLRDELISDFYYKKFPRPGESIVIDLTNVTGDTSRLRPSSEPRPGSLDLTSYVHVNTSGYGTLNKKNNNVTLADYEDVTIEDDPTSPSVTVTKNGRVELVLTLHHDSRYEEADLKPLHQLPPDILLKIFASLLLERKVILISCVISKLSCCVDALQSILYPFSWPHTFIPILPQCLWDVVESPTPVICGILSVNVVNNHKIEDGIVVDLDEGNIVSEEGDENSILSDSMKKAWHQGLSLANTVPPDHYAHSVYLSDAYIKVFIASLKHYKAHIVEGSFDKEGFIRNGKTKGIRRFLKWFTETTMFISFIDTVLSNPESFTLFDKKIEMYGSDESNMILTKLLEWKK